ncbi:MAG: SitI3 family protein [Pyrinomonadaceae bacterium]
MFVENKRLTGTTFRDQANSRLQVVDLASPFSTTDSHKDYGFRPTINIILGLHPSDSYEEGKELIARAIVPTLRQINGDAALFYNGEMPILQRCYGHLTIKEGWGDWHMSYLDAADLLYQQRETVTSAA